MTHEKIFHAFKHKGNILPGIFVGPKLFSQTILEVPVRDVGAVQDETARPLRLGVPAVEEEAVADDAKLEVARTQFEVEGHLVPAPLHQSFGVERRAVSV